MVPLWMRGSWGAVCRDGDGGGGGGGGASGTGTGSAGDTEGAPGQGAVGGTSGDTGTGVSAQDALGALGIDIGDVSQSQADASVGGLGSDIGAALTNVTKNTTATTTFGRASLLGLEALGIPAIGLNAAVQGLAGLVSGTPAEGPNGPADPGAQGPGSPDGGGPDTPSVGLDSLANLPRVVDNATLIPVENGLTRGDLAAETAAKAKAEADAKAKAEAEAAAKKEQEASRRRAKAAADDIAESVGLGRTGGYGQSFGFQGFTGDFGLANTRRPVALGQ